MYLHDDAWTKAETDHLFDLARRFDLRFVVIHDRYDHQQFKVSPKGQGAASNLPLWHVQGSLHCQDQIILYNNLTRGKLINYWHQGILNFQHTALLLALLIVESTVTCGRSLTCFIRKLEDLPLPEQQLSVP